MIGRKVVAWLALGLVMGAIGCGDASSDPFVGTWRNIDPKTKPDTRVVIAEVDATYRLAVDDRSGPLPYSLVSGTTRKSVVGVFRACRAE